MHLGCLVGSGYAVGHPGWSGGETQVVPRGKPGGSPVSGCSRLLLPQPMSLTRAAFLQLLHSHRLCGWRRVLHFAQQCLH